MSNNVGTLVYNAINGLFAGGLWSGKAEEDNPTTPYGIYIYFGTTNWRLDGRAPLQNQRFQLDIYGDTHDACAAVADQVEAAMDANSWQGSPPTFTATQLTRHFFPPDTETHLQRLMLEFSLWYQP